MLQQKIDAHDAMKALRIALLGRDYEDPSADIRDDREYEFSIRVVAGPLAVSTSMQTSDGNVVHLKMGRDAMDSLLEGLQAQLVRYNG